VVDTAHVDCYCAGRLAVVEADDAGEVRVDRRRNDMRGGELDLDWPGAHESGLDFVRVLIGQEGSIALQAEVRDPLVGRRGDVDALEGRRDVDLRGRQGVCVWGKEADRQTQSVG